MRALFFLAKTALEGNFLHRGRLRRKIARDECDHLDMVG